MWSCLSSPEPGLLCPAVNRWQSPIREQSQIEQRPSRGRQIPSRYCTVASVSVFPFVSAPITFDTMAPLPRAGTPAARCAPTPRPPSSSAATRGKVTPASSPKRHPSATVLNLGGRNHICSCRCCNCRWQCSRRCAEARVNSSGAGTSENGGDLPSVEERGRGGTHGRSAGVFFAGWARLGGLARRLHESCRALLYDNSSEPEWGREQPGGG